MGVLHAALAVLRLLHAVGATHLGQTAAVHNAPAAPVRCYPLLVMRPMLLLLGAACRNNENLARLSCKIISPLVFAHVRAAYPGMPVSEQNCHPFQWGRYIWMHNGVVGGFSRIKRRLLDQLSDAAYNSIQSFHSDSAVSFAVFLNHLPDLVQQQQPNVLLNAMQVGQA